MISKKISSSGSAEPSEGAPDATSGTNNQSRRLLSTIPAKMAQTAPDDSNADQAAALLVRLSQKEGVQATIAIDQNTGIILKKTGDISFPIGIGTRPSTASNAGSNGLDDSASKDSDEVRGIEDMAMMVWKFVQAAGGLIQGLDSEDEVKLLRLRTKKHELVIVPDSRYLLVVVRETPAA